MSVARRLLSKIPRSPDRCGAMLVVFRRLEQRQVACPCTQVGRAETCCSARIGRSSAVVVRRICSDLLVIPASAVPAAPRCLVGIKSRQQVLRLIIHGARSALPVPAGNATPRGELLRALMTRVHRNVAMVAWQQLQNFKTDIRVTDGCGMWMRLLLPKRSCDLVVHWTHQIR